MTLSEIYPFLAVFYINLAILAIALPNDLIDTSSFNRNLIAVLIIISGMFGLRQHIAIALIILAIISAAAAIHYLRIYLAEKQKLRTIKTEQILQDHPSYKRVD